MGGLLSLALCAVFALTAYTDALAVAAAVALAQALLASSTSAGQTVPAPRLAATVVVTGGFLASALTLWPQMVGAGDVPASLAGLAPAAAVVMLMGLVGQMLRRDGRAGLTSWLGLTVTLGLLAVLLASWVAAARLLDGAALVTVAAVAVATASVVLSVPGPALVVGVGAVLAATGGAAALCRVVPDAPVWAFGAAFGLTAGLLTVVGRRLGAAWSSSPAHRVPVEAVAPLALVGPVLVVASQLFVH